MILLYILMLLLSQCLQLPTLNTDYSNNHGRKKTWFPPDLPWTSHVLLYVKYDRGRLAVPSLGRVGCHHAAPHAFTVLTLT